MIKRQKVSSVHETMNRKVPQLIFQQQVKEHFMKRDTEMSEKKYFANWKSLFSLESANPFGTLTLRGK